MTKNITLNKLITGGSGNTTVWTMSCFCRFDRDSDDDSNLLTGFWGSSYYAMHIGFKGNGQFQMYDWADGANSANQWSVGTARRFQDSGTWYHVTVYFNSAEGIASNRVKLWINGELQTLTDQNGWTNSFPPQGLSSAIFHYGKYNQVGGFWNGASTSKQFVGSIAEFYLVQSVEGPDTFAKQDSNRQNQWVPKHPDNVKANVTFGQHGFYLPFKGNKRFWNRYTTDEAGKSLGYSGAIYNQTSGFSKGKKSSKYSDYRLAGSQNPGLIYSNSSDFDFGTGDYTLETWLAWESWSGTNQRLFLYGQSGNSIIEVGRNTSANNLYVYHNMGSAHISYPFSPTAKQWYHLAIVRQSGTSRLYIDGTQVQADGSSGSSASIPNNGSNMQIGGLDWANGYFHQGWMDGVRIIKGQCLYPSGTAFTPAPVLSPTTYSADGGSTTSNISGTVAVCWSPDFDVLGSDYSDNTNCGLDATPDTHSGSTTASTQKNMFPSFSINYADPNVETGFVASGGYQYLTNNANGDNTVTTNMSIPNTGKYYFEIRRLDGDKNYGEIGIANYDKAHLYDIGYNTNWMGHSTNDGHTMYYWPSNVASFTWRGFWVGAYGINSNSGRIYSNPNAGSDNGRHIMFAVDRDNAKVYMGLDGSWVVGDPEAGTGGQTLPNNDDTWGPCASFWNGTGFAENMWNFGQDPTFKDNNTTSNSDASGLGQFKYTVPTGYNAICTETQTAYADAALDPDSHFKVASWVGNHSYPRQITTGFETGFTWVRDRTTGYHWRMFDTVRGSAPLYSNSTITEDSPNDGPEAICNSTGFQIIDNPDGTNSAGYGVNQNGSNYNAFTWSAPNSGVTNTQGSLNSTVHANTTAGFSIVKYTTTSNVYTWGHGLNSAPEFIIIKGDYDGGRGNTYNWDVYHKSVGPTGRLVLNSNSSIQTYSGPWNDTNPSDTVVTQQGSSWYANGSDNIAYVWTGIPGYSKFGHYQGSNGGQNTFCYLGFKPALVIIKNMDATEHWVAVNNAANPHNPASTVHYPNLTNADSGDGTQFYLTSDGFALRDGTATRYNSNHRFAYAAWAETPQWFANAR